jgi:hypothetical protein
MQSSWFGDLSGEPRCGILGEKGLSAYHAILDMPTAIFPLYTSQGWVIASDGLGSDGIVIDPNVQKIFPINGGVLAHATMGSIRICNQQNTIIDFGVQLSRTAEALRRKHIPMPIST